MTHDGKMQGVPDPRSKWISTFRKRFDQTSEVSKKKLVHEGMRYACITASGVSRLSGRWSMTGGSGAHDVIVTAQVRESDSRTGMILILNSPGSLAGGIGYQPTDF